MHSRERMVSFLHLASSPNRSPTEEFVRYEPEVYDPCLRCDVGPVPRDGCGRATDASPETTGRELPVELHGVRTVLRAATERPRRDPEGRIDLSLRMVRLGAVLRLAEGTTTMTDDDEIDLFFKHEQMGKNEWPLGLDPLTGELRMFKKGEKPPPEFYKEPMTIDPENPAMDEDDISDLGHYKELEKFVR